MGKFIWVFGLISGFLASLSEFLVYKQVIHFDAFGGIRIFKLLVLVICIVFAAIAIKKSKGSISLLRTLFVSFMVSLLRSVVLIAGFLLMYYPQGNLFKPVASYAVEKSMEMMKPEERTPKNMAIKKKEIEHQFSLEGYPQFALMGSVLTGLVTGVFLGLVIAKRPTDS